MKQKTGMNLRNSTCVAVIQNEARFPLVKVIKTDRLIDR